MKTVDKCITGLDTLARPRRRGSTAASFNGQRPTNHRGGSRSPSLIQQGKCALETEKQKIDWYRTNGDGRGSLVVPMAIDSYGFVAPRFRKLIHQLAKRTGVLLTGSGRYRCRRSRALCRREEHILMETHHQGALLRRAYQRPRNRSLGASMYHTRKFSVGFDVDAAVIVPFMEHDTAGARHTLVAQQRIVCPEKESVP
eukprot:31557-Pelagococcus_subviridis.AAC.5